VAHAAPIETPQMSPVRSRSAALVWGIQVGSYATERAAREAAYLGRHVADTGEARTEAATVHHRTIWRAQVTGLTSQDAETACSALAHRRMPCAVMRSLAGQVASR
jgi:D-alanyl-D-alanine carboxypeptidase